MKLRETVRYELRYQARRPISWLFVAIVAALVFLLAGASQIEDAKSGGTPVNAPFPLAGLTLFGGFIALLPIAAFAGEAAARDVTTRMTPLVYTTPVGKATYLGGRFLAALVLAALVAAAVSSGILVAVVASGVDPALLGPLRVAYYAAAWAFVGLPDAIIAASLAFAAATLARRPMAGLVASAALFVASILCFALLALTLGHWTLAAALDPLGLTTILELTRSWTPEAKRTGIPWLAASYVRNRALWLGVAAGVLALTHRRFRFAHHVPVARRARAESERVTPMPNGVAASAVAASAVAANAVAVPAARTFGPRTHARQFAAVVRESWRVVVLGGGGLVALALFALVVATGPDLMQHLDVPLVPTTAQVATTVGSPGMWPALVAWLLIAYYAGELVWRDRDAGLGEIAGAAPVPDWVYVLGRAGGLALALATYQAVVMAAAMVVQLRMGFTALEPWLHVRFFLGLQLADLLLFAGLAVALHVAAAQKYVGHLAIVLVYAFTIFAGRLGIEHRLLVFAADPGWSYFAMRGFGGTIGPWLTLELYWAAWTALLLVGAALLWMRGREDTVAMRLRTARRRLTRGPVGAASGAAACVLALGAFTFYNTNVLHEYRSSARRDAERVDYERRYRRFARIAQPRLDAIALRAELHPAAGTAEIRGSYRVVNRAAVAIDSVHVTTTSALAVDSLSFDRPATRVLADARLGYHVFALGTPLRPGDTLRLAWVARVGSRGFANTGADDLVTAGATFIRSGLLPRIGYQADRELDDAGARRDHGLPARPRIPVLDDLAARSDVDWVDAERVTVETVVGTDTGQRAVAPGALRRTWLEGGRRWFDYAAERPIIDDFALFSAAYAVRSDVWRNPITGRAVEIEVLHDPTHPWNVDGLLASMRASLAQLSATLGPYPYGELRMVEHPGAGGAHAFPINVGYEEGLALLDPAWDRHIDFPFAVAAHEIAHQWWGIQLVPAAVEGISLMSESLAWYSALGVVERARGHAEMERLVAFMREAWLPPRPPSDPPLLRATGWFLGYRKGPLAMYGLREYVGAEPVDVALRRLIAANASGAPPLPTTRDLYRELEAVTPDSLRYLVHDLFAANTLWELATERVSAEPGPNGTRRLTLDVRARKITVDTAGRVRELPMHDLVEIGAFADSAGDTAGASVYRALHRIRSGRQRITITVPAGAAWAGVDPRHLLFDLDPQDNVARLPRTP